MDCIELMVEEHKVAKRMLVIIREYCNKILKDEEIDYEDFFAIIDFLRNFVDKHHHGKEEKILFNEMRNKLGVIGDKLITSGMLVEHDLGRLHIQELEIAVKKVIDGDDDAKLDVIGQAMAYNHLLNRHIDKEDEIVYTFARKNLDKETLDQVNKDCIEFEKNASEQKIQDKYISILEEMEKSLAL